MVKETPRTSSVSARTFGERLKAWSEPARHFSWWTSWFYILIGVIVMCAGFVFFINPYNIVPGGVYGASIVLHNIFPSIQVGTFGYFFDVPLLVLASIFLGAKLGDELIEKLQAILIDARDRLIEEQKIRRGIERERKKHALQFTARQRTEPSINEMLGTHARKAF